MTPSEFVSLVVKKYNASEGIFKNKVNAEELVPSDLNDLERAFYIFYVLQLDYAMKSQILYKGARRLYFENPSFFNVHNIDALNEEELEIILKEYLHPRYVNEAVRRYKYNSKILLNKYDGDPRKIFYNVSGCQEVLKRLKDFRGLGPKIGNFFVRTMINTFDYTYNDIDTILPPVDVHDVRIAYLMGYIQSDQMTEKNIHSVKELWNKACVESGESWLIFDKALWLLGSEGRPKSRGDVIDLL